jgi:hypothetical protein
MTVRFTRRIGRPVRVLVMRVVVVEMLVFHRVVRVLVLMPLGEVKPHTCIHE